MPKTTSAPSSKSGSSKKSAGTSKDESKKSREVRHEEQRRRNIDSAKRSRERLKFEDKWMQVQTLETSDRIGRLEKEVGDLSAQIGKSSRSQRSQGSESRDDRPSWFGDAFWKGLNPPTGGPHSINILAWSHPTNFNHENSF